MLDIVGHVFDVDMDGYSRLHMAGCWIWLDTMAGHFLDTHLLYEKIDECPAQTIPLSYI